MSDEEFRIIIILLMLIIIVLEYFSILFKGR